MGITGRFHRDSNSPIRTKSSSNGSLRDRMLRRGVNISPFRASCTQPATENCHQSRAVCSDSSETAQRGGDGDNGSEARARDNPHDTNCLQATAAKYGSRKTEQKNRTDTQRGGGRKIWTRRGETAGTTGGWRGAEASAWMR